MRKPDPISNIFRLALFIFATTFGIGIYALIGAPVLRIDQRGLLQRAGSAIASVGNVVTRFLPAAHLPEMGGKLQYTLIDPSDDIPGIKHMIADDIPSAATKEIVLSKNGKTIGGEALLEYLDRGTIPQGLQGALSEVHYMVRKGDTPIGTLTIKTTSGEFAYVELLTYEKKLATALMQLIHPDLGSSEARMFAKIPFVSRTINGLDARTLTNSADEPILIWALKGDLFVVSGSKQDFILATSK